MPGYSRALCAAWRAASRRHATAAPAASAAAASAVGAWILRPGNVCVVGRGGAEALSRQPHAGTRSSRRDCNSCLHSHAATAASAAPSAAGARFAGTPAGQPDEHAERHPPQGGLRGRPPGALWAPAAWLRPAGARARRLPGARSRMLTAAGCARGAAAACKLPEAAGRNAIAASASGGVWRCCVAVWPCGRRCKVPGAPPVPSRHVTPRPAARPAPFRPLPINPIAGRLHKTMAEEAAAGVADLQLTADGGDFGARVREHQPYFQRRVELFIQYKAREDAAREAAKAAAVPIRVVLPDGAGARVWRRAGRLCSAGMPPQVCALRATICRRPPAAAAATASPCSQGGRQGRDHPHGHRPRHLQGPGQENGGGQGGRRHLGPAAPPGGRLRAAAAVL